MLGGRGWCVECARGGRGWCVECARGGRGGV